MCNKLLSVHFLVATCWCSSACWSPLNPLLCGVTSRPSAVNNIAHAVKAASRNFTGYLCAQGYSTATDVKVKGRSKKAVDFWKGVKLSQSCIASRIKNTSLRILEHKSAVFFGIHTTTGILRNPAWADKTRNYLILPLFLRKYTNSSSANHTKLKYIYAFIK